MNLQKTLVPFVSGFFYGVVLVEGLSEGQTQAQGATPVGVFMNSIFQSFQLVYFNRFALSLTAVACKKFRGSAVFVNLATLFGCASLITAGLIRAGYLKKEKLSPNVICFLNFTSKRFPSFIYCAVIVTSVALIAIGRRFLGAGALVMAGYGVIKSRLPEKVESFVEGIRPFIAFVGSCAERSILGIPFCTYDLASKYLFSRKTVNFKIDAFLCKLFKRGPSLEKVYAPIEENKSPSFDEIQHVLNFPRGLKLDQRHCTKVVLDENVPENRNYNLLLAHYDRIEWPSLLPVLTRKMMQDDRFIDYLKNEFPVFEDENLRLNFEEHVRTLSERAGITSEQFKLNWVRSQMMSLCDNLTGVTRMAGSLENIEAARLSVARVLACLESRQDLPEITKQDFLLGLAIDAGGYCAQGVSRATSYMLEGIVAAEAPGEDPNLNYSRQLKMRLHFLRAQVVDRSVQAVFQQWCNREQVQEAVLDVHFRERMTLYLKLGFCPLSEDEQEKCDLVMMILRKVIYHNLCEILKDDYEQRLAEIFTRDPVKISIYISDLIQNNGRLTSREKDNLITSLQEGGSMFWHRDGLGNLSGAERFILYSLGILSFSP